MDLRYPPSAEEFRERVRAFIADGRLMVTRMIEPAGWPSSSTIRFS